MEVEAAQPFSRAPKLCEQCRALFRPGSAGHVPPQRQILLCGHKAHTMQLNGILGETAEYRHHTWHLHHATALSMAAALEYGCEFCSEYARHARTELLNSPKPKEWHPHATCVGIGGMADGGSTWSFLFQEMAETDFSTGVVLRSHTSYVDDLPEHVARPPTTLNATSTGSSECISLAKYWLQDCLSNHNECPKPSTDVSYPTRLLKLQDGHAILVDTAEQTIKEPYATLSHCWGKERFTVLTPTTMSMFRKGMAVDTFLPTFRDAMLTTQKLGISYIWIDCLCIIQGTSDWDIEAGRMCDVYTGGLINFGASHGSSPRAGCFVQRDPEKIKKRVIRWQPTKKQEEHLYEIFTPETPQPDTSYGMPEPLYRRGWVAQERVLCSRMLHFGDQQIKWECPTSGILNEIKPHTTDEPAYNQYDSGLVPAELMSLQEDELSLNEKRELASEFWYRIIKTYSRLALTYPKDKLPAIQGVADYINRQIEDEYLFGFFAFSLPKTLCFRRRGNRPKRRMPAPSWSWAHWHGSVDLPLESMDDVSGEMLATYITFQEVQFQGEMIRPLLYCLGKLLPLRRHRSEAFINGHKLGSWENTVEEDDEAQAASTLFCLPICARMSTGDTVLPLGHPHVGNNTVYLKMLLLKQVNGGRFQRHGNCDLWLNYEQDACVVSKRLFLDLYRSTATRLVVIE